MAMARALLFWKTMGRICQHCGAPFGGSAYRVKSEESGVTLLDIIVCHHCCVEAQKLSLYTEEVRFNSSSTPRDDMKGREKRPPS
jgi:hypothetical protein